VKVVCVVQARMGSTRLPGKVLKKTNGRTLIEILLSRLSKSKKINQIVLATSDNKNNNELISHVQEIGYKVYVGNESDVLDRYYHASLKYNADVVVRVTGDCPLIDWNIVDKTIEKFFGGNFDYVSNVQPPTFPDGLDVEVFSFKALEKAWSEASSDFEREHVTPFLKNLPGLKRANFSNSSDMSKSRWTVDEPEDFVLVDKIISHFSPNIDFSWAEVKDLEDAGLDFFDINKHIVRNEGEKLGEGQKLWKRAKKIIPGGNMLLSKRSEMFLPDQWPSYFSKAKGCNIWDLSNNKYTDFSIMGIGTNTLGYGNDEVDDAVRDVINMGNMSTLNCPEEVYLAERLVELHPWAEMVRFARSGGEANAIAIRIARAASGKDNVAICGYHGWHDWYLSANLSEDKNLDGHLLPGLQPNGVPRNLKNSVFTFQYNDFKSLEDIVNKHDVGVIKMEVQRSEPPKNNFLKKVRELATKKNIVLIFDECSSGFRQTFGGLHKKYGVNPDMAMFGKTLGNGYAITAVIGKREVMNEAQNTFISSTFWTERIGPVAAIKTLEVMEKVHSWEKITKVGQEVTNEWKKIAKENNLSIKINGIPALTGFVFESPNSLEYKTLITQEMLKQNFLASTSFYPSICHSKDIINEYLENLEKIFKLIAKCEDGLNVESLLEGPVCHSGFRRLN